MARFIMVFCKNAADALTELGYNLVMYDERNETWRFETKTQDEDDIPIDYPYVLSSILSF